MQSWKTTLTGILAALASIAAHYNIVLTPDFQTSIVVIAITVMGWLAKDANTNEVK